MPLSPGRYWAAGWSSSLLANILIEPGRVELREIKTPSPHNGELLVEIKAALTCGTDLKAFRRGHPVIPMPGVFGHEFSGIVASVGKKVKEFKEGDEIMAVHSAPCLECSYCKRKLYNLCDKLMDTKVLGTFAEYILLPPHIVKQNVFLKPGSLTFEEAAFLEPLSCVVHGIAPLYIKEGDYTLIIGAGPIGLLHLLLLKEKSAVVTVIDKHREKLKVAKDLGADFVFTSENFDKVIPLFGKGGRGGFLGLINSPILSALILSLNAQAYRRYGSHLLIMQEKEGPSYFSEVVNQGQP